MMRLDKLLAHSGYGTRKDVNKIIKAKLVEVNGVVITKGDTKVDEFNDQIVVDGFLVEYLKHVYIMLNKPEGYVSATIDNVYPTVTELVVEYDYLDLFVVGRLDVDTTGLLLLTNDGSWAHNITSPKKKIEKEYEALIDGELDSQQIKQLEQGVVIANDYLTAPASVEILQKNETTSLIKIIITEGKFHQVKQMFERVNHYVLALKRVRIKDVVLDENLELGDYRLLTDVEISSFNSI